MRRLALALLLLLTTSLVHAGGEIIREGDVVVFKADCLALNMAEFNQLLPQGRTTAEALVILFAATMRPLTATERALCDGVPVIVPIWRVHDNGNITRPAYTYMSGLLVKHPTERATIGEPCGAFTAPVANRTTQEYRYLTRRPDLVAICEFR